MSIGDVFEYHGGKYVLIDTEFREWPNTGGMGDTSYYCMYLDDMIELGNVKDIEHIKVIEFDDAKGFNLSDVKVLKDEAPFDISIRQPILYTIRRKELKTVSVYE